VAVAGLGGVRQIALGATFGCALDAAGAVACWGDNSSGQLGTGSDAPHGAAAKITSLGSVRTIHTGGAFACALTVAGELLCWGDNQAGQLGQGDPAVSRAPLPMAW
jgi:alpha-tubulin suppressor-like RCC1 family protein